MTRHRKLSSLLGAVLGTFCALALLAVQAHASDWVTEEFHKTYPLSADGRVSLENINGSVHISGWDKSEVQVDAVKRAGSRERLEEAKIEVEAGPFAISVRTHYPDRDLTFNSDDDRHNPATVEYTLHVPHAARIDEVKLINGGLDIQGLTGEVHASSINGKVVARELNGRTELSTVNGRVEADFARLGTSPIELSSVNGSVRLTLPSDAKADVEANTVMGGISNDFGLRVHHGRYVGHDVDGRLGDGGTRIRLKNVNGRIEIEHAQDHRPLSPAKDMGSGDRDDDDTI